MWDLEKVYSGVVGRCNIAFDQASERIHITFYDPFKSRLMYATRASGETVWQLEEIYAIRDLPAAADLPKANPGVYHSLAVDSKGRPHVAFSKRTGKVNDILGQLIYSYRDNGWHPDYVSGSDVSVGACGINCRLRLDSKDRPHIVFMERFITPPSYWYAFKTYTEEWKSLWHLSYASLHQGGFYTQKLLFMTLHPHPAEGFAPSLALRDQVVEEEADVDHVACPFDFDLDESGLPVIAAMGLHYVIKDAVNYYVIDGNYYVIDAEGGAISVTRKLDAAPEGKFSPLTTLKSPLPLSHGPRFKGKTSYPYVQIDYFSQIRARRVPNFLMKPADDNPLNMFVAYREDLNGSFFNGYIPLGALLVSPWGGDIETGCASSQYGDVALELSYDQDGVGVHLLFFDLGEFPNLRLRYARYWAPPLVMGSPASAPGKVETIATGSSGRYSALAVKAAGGAAHVAFSGEAQRGLWYAARKPDQIQVAAPPMLGVALP